MKSTFSNLGIKPEQWFLLILMAKSPIDGKIYYFVDKCLPFGAAISCSHFQRFSDAIAHILKHRTGYKAPYYLDDFLFVAVLKATCDDLVHQFINICNLIAFPISMEKTFWSCTELTFLGLLINSVAQVVSIPVEKIECALSLIHGILGKRTVMIRDMQRICGFLNFLCCCIIPGWAFTRGLYGHFSPNAAAHHHIKVNQEIKQDLTVWKKFLMNPIVYCRPFIDYSDILSADVIEWFTDASGKIGFGGICDSHWFTDKWDAQFLDEQKPSIEYQELFTIMVSILLWCHKFSSRRICLFCDNQSVVHMLNISSSNCKNCMKLIRVITLRSLEHNVRIFAKYVRTDKNYFADALS